MEYSRWTPPDAVAATVAHVRAHLSAIASPDDDEDRYVDEVTIDRAAQGDGLLITGRLDREPQAGYLADGHDPYAGVPAELRAEAER